LFQILSVIFLIKQFGPISLVFVKPFSFQVVLFTVSEYGSQLLEARKHNKKPDRMLIFSKTFF